MSSVVKTILTLDIKIKTWLKIQWIQAKGRYKLRKQSRAIRKSARKYFKENGL